MKVRVKFNIGIHDRNGFPPLAEGEHVVDAKLGASLVAKGYADECEPEKQKGVPEAPKQKGVK